MTKRSPYLIAPLFVVVLLSFTVQKAQSQVSNQDHPYSRIEGAAKRLDPSDAKTARALVDEVFNINHAFGRMDSTAENMIKDRLAQAELAYTTGASKGVDEKDVVKLFNSMMSKFGAPAYAQTSVSQVRYVRVQHLFISAPAFMGRGMHNGNMKAGDSISRKMSPVQATHLLMTLLDGKMFNSFYQLPPAEWEQARYQEELQKWQALTDAKKAGQLNTLNTPPQPKMVSLGGPKTDEMFTVVGKGISNMSLTDGIGLAAEAFQTLGLSW